MQNRQKEPKKSSQNTTYREDLPCTLYRQSQNLNYRAKFSETQRNSFPNTKTNLKQHNLSSTACVLLFAVIAVLILTVSIINTVRNNEGEMSSAAVSLNRNTSLPTATDVTKESTVVCIDPGHGFDDPGALSDYTEEYEKDINLNIALILAQKLKELGYDILMTRDSDMPPDWLDINDDGFYLMNPNKRTAFVNESDADIFISIHCNICEGEPSVTGTKLYYYGPSNPLTLKYATVLRNTLLSEIPERDIEAIATSLEDSLAVNRDISIPGVLVECGYLSSPEDCALLLNDEWCENFASALANGIDQFVQNQK